jgi:5-(aminomethyl)-3-furanmethanol phosphate kinase
MTSKAPLSPTIVKVGGSLFQLPDLGPRLHCWLDRLGARPVLLVPGGGASADVVRTLDRVHGLGQEAAHWLALQALALNARFLAELVAGARIVADGMALAADEIAILDAHAFARADEGQPGCLAHSWDVTSDSVAARCAVRCGARRLVLLKSVEIPAGMSWHEAAQRGLVDGCFAETLRHAHAVAVEALCFRAWQP